MNHLSISHDEVICLRQRAIHKQLYKIAPDFPLVRIEDALREINGNSGTCFISVVATKNCLTFVVGVVQDSLDLIMRLHSDLRIYLRGDWHIQFGQHRLLIGNERQLFRSVEISGKIEDFDLFAKIFNQSVSKIYRGIVI